METSTTPSRISPTTRAARATTTATPKEATTAVLRVKMHTPLSQCQPPTRNPIQQLHDSLYVMTWRPSCRRWCCAYPSPWLLRSQTLAVPMFKNYTHTKQTASKGGQERAWNENTKTKNTPLLVYPLFKGGATLGSIGNGERVLGVGGSRVIVRERWKKAGSINVIRTRKFKRSNICSHGMHRCTPKNRTARLTKALDYTMLSKDNISLFDV